MVSDNLQSPNAIPPRTSSTGLNLGFVPAAKPVLRPVSEGDWISHGKKSSTTSATAAIPNSLRPKMDGMAKGDGTTWSDDKEKILMGPYDYLSNQPGKDVRKQLITAFNAWLNVPEKSLAIISNVVLMLHTSSLL